MNDSHQHFNEALTSLLEASYRVWRTYGQGRDLFQWEDVREALLEMQACRHDLVVPPEYFLDQRKEDVLTG